MFNFVVICSLLGVAVAAPSVPLAAIDSVSVPHYQFNYAVSDPHTGDYKAQTEHREGGVVKGSYSLAEPDGTLRVVDYHADPVSGFNAVVKRLGPAVHPQKVITPVVTKAVATPVVAPVVTHIAAPVVAPVTAPIIAPALDLHGYGDLGYGLGYGMGHYWGHGLDMGHDLGHGIVGLSHGYDIGYGGLGWKH